MKTLKHENKANIKPAVICLFGPQGSGKGTQAKILSKKLNLPHISTGDIFRAAIAGQTELGRQVEKIINSGQLVSDELTFNLLRERVAESDCGRGFILDGYPRTVPQADMLAGVAEVNKVLEIRVSDKESLKRLINRRQCPRCGAIYNLYTAPKPKTDELCDCCQVKLIQRDDDTEEAVKKRLARYHQEAKPLLDYYQDKVIAINGEQSIEQVAEDISKNVMPIS